MYLIFCLSLGMTPCWWPPKIVLTCFEILLHWKGIAVEQVTSNLSYTLMTHMTVPISLANNDWLLLISSLMAQTVYPIKMKLQLEWKQWCCWILPQMLTLQMAPQGSIVNIIPDPRETAHHNCSTTSTVFLQYPPPQLLWFDHFSTLAFPFLACLVVFSLFSQPC